MSERADVTCLEINVLRDQMLPAVDTGPAVTVADRTTTQLHFFTDGFSWLPAAV
jgi:hypothetical protein